MVKINNNLCDRTPIGANPRRYFGFPNPKNLKSHIKKHQPRLYHCIGKIKELKAKREFTDGMRSDYLVYFKVRKN